MHPAFVLYRVSSVPINHSLKRVEEYRYTHFLIRHMTAHKHPFLIDWHAGEADKLLQNIYIALEDVNCCATKNENSDTEVMLKLAT